MHLSNTLVHTRLRRLLHWGPAGMMASRRSFDVFRRQESTLILLNLCLLVSLLLVHVGFVEALGAPPAWLVAVFGARFVLQTGELMLLQGVVTPWPARRIAVHEHVAIAVHVLFAAAVSLLSQREDSHYTVLMVLPVVAAAFRYRLGWAFFVAGLAGSVAVLDVRLSGETEPLSEYFEAVSMGLVFVLVSVIVHVLVRQLEWEQHQRQDALEALSLTRERLAQEEKLSVIGRLASAVAHEIRNPIAMIASSLAAVAENEDDPALREEMFDIAATEAALLERFTGEFLAYARTTAPQRETVHLDATLEYIASLARAQAQSEHVKLEVFCSGCGTLPADPYHLHQALLNLVKNAIEATPPMGVIRLSCARTAEAVLLHVENDGPPVPEGLVPRLFEPFFTSKPDGTGLGLGIAQNIARAHGGDLALTANGPDQVRFTMTLPNEPPDLGEGS